MNNFPKDNRNSTISIITKTIVFTLIIFLSLILLLFVSLITKPTRIFLANLGLSIVNKNINARVSISDLRFNPFIGVKIENLYLSVDGDTLLFLPRAYIDWDFAMLFEKKLFIKLTHLENPQVKLVRKIGDDKWNFEKIFPPSEEKESKPLNLLISIENFEFKNGNLTIFDYNHHPEEAKFDPTAIILTNLNFAFDGHLNLKNQDFSINFEKLHFFENRTKLNVENISCVVKAKGDSIQVDHLSILTSESNILGSATVNLPVSDSSITKIKLNFDKSIASTNDILRFAPDIFDSNNLIKFNGQVSIAEDIYFKNFQIKLPNSIINCQGKIELPDSNHLSTFVYFDIPSAIIFEGDIKNILKPIFPETPINFSKVFLHNFNFKFIDSTIYLDGKLSSELGNFIARFSYNLDGETSGKITFRNLDLTNLKGFPLNSTSINGEVVVSKLNLANIENSAGFVKVYVEHFNFPEYQFVLKEFYSEITLKDGIINLDTLTTIVDYPDINEYGKIDFTGSFKINKGNIIDYFGKLKVVDINLKESFKIARFPTNITGIINFKGKGFDLNSIILELDSKIQRFEFEDRILIPFSLSLSMNNSNDERKFIKINSNVAQFEMEGKYEFLSLVEDLSEQFSTLEKTFVDKFKVFTPSDTSEQIVRSSSSKKTKSFNNSSFVANINVQDFSLFSLFMNLDLNFSGFAKLKFSSTDTSSSLNLDTFAIKYLNFTINNNPFKLMNFDIFGDYHLTIRNGIPYLDYIRIYSFTNSKLVFSNSFFNYFVLNLNLSKEFLKYNLETSFEDLVELSSNGTISFEAKKIVLTTPSLQIGYSKVFKWAVADSFQLEIDPEGYKIFPFTLVRENAETINIEGRLDYQNEILSTIRVNNLPLNDFQKLLPEENSLSKIKNFEGLVRELKVNISHKLDNPQIALDLNAEKLKFEGLYIGNILSNLFYENSNISGETKLTQNETQLLDIIISFLPSKIDLNKMNFVLDNRKIFKAKLFAENFPLSVLNPFIENWVEQLQGKANVNVEINGYFPNDLNFIGDFEILPTTLKLRSNNLSYICQGSGSFDSKSININRIAIQNDKNDLPGGEGTLTGKINFEGNNFNDLSIRFTSSGIKVLSRASAKSMPELFGDLIIATGNKGINIFGNRDETRIEGDINILKGKLSMPSTQTSQSVNQSLVHYQISGKNVQIIDEDVDTILSRRTNPQVYNRRTQKIGNLIVDLSIGIINPIEVTLDVATIGQIYAIITLSDQHSLLRYYLDFKSNITLVTGNDLILREGSTLKFIKTFNTSGTINFPIGSLDNPSLNIKAEYVGQSIYNDAVRNYTITIYLTGSKESPNLRFEYTIDNQPSRGDTSRIAQDALFLLAFGRTRSEMEKGNGSGVDLENFSSSGGSAILSKILSDALTGTGFISSADISFGSSSVSSFDKAKLRMTGNFLGMTWNFGGTVADLMNNSEITIEIPFGLIFRPEILRNFFIQLSRTTSINQNPQPNQKDWEVKLRYGTSW
ncbi:MAG: DUF748 domain-containing protein [Candidatus Kapaibacteriales bacterium]